MSLPNFWAHVRTGAGMLTPTVPVDSPKLDALKNKRALQDLWLTSDAVEGFNENDFKFLAPDEREKLVKSVQRVLEVASQVPPDTSPPDQKVQEALPEFRCILEILRLDKYSDPEAFVIGKKLEQLLKGRLPEWVRDLRLETGPDVIGDPALWVWVELDDDAARKEVFANNTKMVQQKLEAAIHEIGVERWPFVRFRTVSERERPSK